MKPARNEEPVLYTIEAATELLRRVDVQAWVWWFGGTFPFVAALLHFCTDMSRAASAWDRLPEASLMLALAYGWMKVAHSVFSDHLLRYLRGDDSPSPMTIRSKLRFVTSTAMIHCTTPWVLVLAFLAMLPFGWAYAFYHNVTVLALSHFRAGGKTRDLIRLALNQSHYRVGQNHSLILMLFIFAMIVFLNVMVGTVQIASLTRTFTGDDNAITRNPIGTMFSTTMLASCGAFGYALVGPLVKAIYALRCFRGLSRKNGEDLLVAFRRAAVALVLLLGVSVSTASAQEVPSPQVTAVAESPAVKPALDPLTLGKNIKEVLEEDRYQWRLPRDEKRDEANKGWLSGFTKTIGDWVKGVKDSMGQLFDNWVKAKLKEWLRGLHPSEDSKDSAPATPWADMAQSVMKVLLGILVAALLVLIIRQWMKLPPAPAKADAAAPEINLENEQIIASQLPENEWLRLAQEKIDAGDYRLALRALFLATLSHLGERRFLAIVKSKSNGEYDRELALRARDRAELRGRFTDNVRRFDWAWYGLHDVTRDLLDEFRNNHQLIVSDAAPR